MICTTNNRIMNISSFSYMPQKASKRIPSTKIPAGRGRAWTFGTAFRVAIHVPTEFPREV
jgi:hypothetical protein